MNLLNPRHHHVEYPAMTFQGDLLNHLHTALHAIADLLGEPFRLSQYASGRLQQAAIGHFQPVSARHAPLGRSPAPAISRCGSDRAASCRQSLPMR
jgi:hypothetical protein